MNYKKKKTPVKFLGTFYGLFCFLLKNRGISSVLIDGDRLYYPLNFISLVSSWIYLCRSFCADWLVRKVLLSVFVVIAPVVIARAQESTSTSLIIFSPGKI